MSRANKHNYCKSRRHRSGEGLPFADECLRIAPVLVFGATLRKTCPPVQARHRVILEPALQDHGVAILVFLACALDRGAPHAVNSCEYAVVAFQTDIEWQRILRLRDLKLSQDVDLGLSAIQTWPAN